MHDSRREQRGRLVCTPRPLRVRTGQRRAQTRPRGLCAAGVPGGNGTSQGVGVMGINLMGIPTDFRDRFRIMRFAAVKGLSVFVNVSRLSSSAKDRATPALIRAAPRLCKLHTRAAAVHVKFQTPELKSCCRCRALRSLSIWEVVLPAPRRRHAAGRERHDLPSYVLFIAHHQSSSQGQCGCWPGHRTVDERRRPPPARRGSDYVGVKDVPPDELTQGIVNDKSMSRSSGVRSRSTTWPRPAAGRAERALATSPGARAKQKALRLDKPERLFHCACEGVTAASAA